MSIEKIVFTTSPEGHVAHIQRVALIFNCYILLHLNVRRYEMQINVFLSEMMQHNRFLFCFVAFRLQLETKKVKVWAHLTFFSVLMTT